MITIKTMVFNGFQVNTYILYDETNECIIIDAANYDKSEDNEIEQFIELNKLKPVYHINTHCHVDHILGGKFIEIKYGIGICIHPESLNFLNNAKDQALMYGFNLTEIANLSMQINDGDKLLFGNSTLDVLYTPGHASGSVCLVNQKDKFVISGDVLFRDSIGRTDLPTGNYDILKQSIFNKLFTLPDVYKVYPGHGPTTTIGYEKLNNPFL